eukprot:m.483183 g.483183  ORF g.483183 m.483183 type:complete len:838 (-) comp22809_c0_seq1:165-2678(-)
MTEYSISDVHQPGLVHRWEPPFNDHQEPVTNAGQTFEEVCVDAKGMQDQERFATAIDKYTMALKLGRAPYGHMGFAYSNIGLCFMAVDNFDRALNYHQCHLECTRVAGDEEMEVVALTNMGVCQLAQRNYDAAIEAHERALGLATKHSLLQGQLQAFANLGNVFAYMGKFQEAIVYHEQQLRVARELQDREAEGRACFNLQSDHNSLQHYDVADTYARKKLTTAGGREALNSGICDHKPTVLVHSGWLVKHKGAALEAEEPSSLQDTRLWCVLQEGIFGYHNDTRAGLTARRYIKLSEVASVHECALYDDEHVQPTRSFRINTEQRSFFFTCETPKDCSDWIEALRKTKSGFVPFVSDATHGGVRGNNNPLARPASQYFDAGPRAPSGGVQNPLFHDSSYLQDEDPSDTLYNIGHINVSVYDEAEEQGDEDMPPGFHDDEFGLVPLGTPVDLTHVNTMGGWESDETVQRECKYLGTKPLPLPQSQRGMPPIRDVHSAVQDLERSNESLDVNLTVAEKQIIARTLPSFAEAPKEVTIHAVSQLVNVMNFDTSIAVVLETFALGKKGYECAVYSCDSVDEATALKEVIARRNAGQRTTSVSSRPGSMSRRVEVNDAYVEESEMTTIPIPSPGLSRGDVLSAPGYFTFEPEDNSLPDEAAGYLQVTESNEPIVRVVSIPDYDVAKPPSRTNTVSSFDQPAFSTLQRSGYDPSSATAAGGVESHRTLHGARSAQHALIGVVPGEDADTDPVLAPPLQFSTEHGGEALTDSTAAPLEFDTVPGESQDHTLPRNARGMTGGQAAAASEGAMPSLDERQQLEREAGIMVDTFYELNQVPKQSQL